MKRLHLAYLIMALLAAASLAGCSMGAAAPTAVPTLPPTQAATQPPAMTTTPEASPTAESRGACDNALFPAVKGATWTYSGTGGPSRAYSYTDTVTDVRADGFTVTSKFDDNLTRTQEWACKPEGLVALQLPGGAAAITTKQFQANFETSNVQGVTIPASVDPGDKWSFSLTIKGTQEVGGVKAETSGDAAYDFTAVGTESVTVPAGTFDAMKVDGVLTLNLTATVSGLSIPVKVTINTTSWFAPGVGMVKTVSNGNVAGTDLNDTLELQTYNIP
ncbi:MAG: hypothetical protein ACM3QS_11555 [Bacteroidota bacterium]